MADEQTMQQWTELARQLRIDSIRCTTQAGSGHPTSSMSAADLMAVLMISYLKYDPAKPHAPYNDHLIFSKGHAAPLVYAMYKAAGWITDEEMMTLRQFGSRIEGHPVPILPFVDVATGSLGQGLPIGGRRRALRPVRRQAAVQNLRALRRLRNGRRLHVGRLR